MDLPDPIGWQLARKQREKERKRGGGRAGKARAFEPGGGGRAGGGRRHGEGCGPASGIEERDEKGKVEGAGDGRGGQSSTGLWGKGWDSAPRHTHWSLTHHQAVHPQLQTRARPPLASLFSGPPVFEPTGLGPPLALGKHGAMSPM